MFDFLHADTFDAMLCEMLGKPLIAAALIALVASLSFGGLSARAGTNALGSVECGPKGAKTLQQDADIRLFRGRASNDDPPPVFGCLKPDGPPKRLGPLAPQGPIWASSLTGPFGLSHPWMAGVEVQLRGQDSVRIYATARNLRTGTGRHCLVGGADRPGQLPKIHSLDLSSNGTAVWAAVIRLGIRGPQIGACDAGGSRVIAASPDIDLKSVEVKGATVRWLEAGVRRTASLLK